MGNTTGRHPILLISLDAVSDSNVDFLLSLPNFRKLASLGVLHRDVDSLFVSNTYPIHTSISTGVLPEVHGVYDNTIQEPGSPIEIWRDHKRFIHATTLPEKAKAKDLRTCAMMYPMTSGEKIMYHFPEIPGKISNTKKALRLLHYGSLPFMAHYYMKFGRDLKSHNHRGMDDFITHTATDLLSKDKADLYMLHLLDVDSSKHKFGATSDEAFSALRRIDERLGAFYEAFQEKEKRSGNNSGAIENLDILIFSDHSCLDVKRAIRPNDLLSEHGISFETAYFHSTHGCCFLHVKPNLTGEEKESLEAFEEIFLNHPGIKRRLTDEEMKVSGAAAAGFALGYAAEAGTMFGKKRKGQHGYTLDNDDYKTFYLEIGPNLVAKNEDEPKTPGSITSGGCILEVGTKVNRLVESR
ncbi:MAG: alkaline phosphatase family protein [Clostridiales bacterium]|nr:alkaline phosphatase family protein [Clostridiales bacterium]